MTSVPPELRFCNELVWEFPAAKSVQLRSTYQASGTNSEGRSSLANSAVSCGDDSAGVQQRASAEVRAALLQADNEGEVASLSDCSTNDVDRVLRGWGSGDCGGHEASDECLVLHLEEGKVLGSEGSECCG